MREHTPVPRNTCLIGGEWITADTGETFAITDPATDEVLARVPAMGAAETQHAIDVAAGAFDLWRATPASDRARAVARLAVLTRQHADQLAALITAEQGKPIAEAAAEVEYAASFLDEAAKHAPSFEAEPIPSTSANKILTGVHEPVGVCAVITPWNFPIAMLTRKLGPALAVGCTAVVKPAEATPLTALAFAGLSIDAGIPPGVLNIITGVPSTIGTTLLADPRVRKLSFTGSTRVGQELMRLAADNVLRLSLELGGNAPFIVFDDADLDAAVAGALAAKFRNAGQTCISANRFLVHRSVHDAFVERFAAGASELKVARGTDPGAQIGPLINNAAVGKVESHIQDALDRGGTLVTGGHHVAITGLADRFFAPSVLTGMTTAMRCFREETFGPLAPVMPFDSEQEAIDLANDTNLGLAAYCYTRDKARMHRVCDALEFGIVGANDGSPSAAQAPFGGVKHSGFGREGGLYALREYTHLKYICRGV